MFYINLHLDFGFFIEPLLLSSLYSVVEIFELSNMADALTSSHSAALVHLKPQHKATVQHALDVQITNKLQNCVWAYCFVNSWIFLLSLLGLSQRSLTVLSVYKYQTIASSL